MPGDEEKPAHLDHPAIKAPSEAPPASHPSILERGQTPPPSKGENLIDGSVAREYLARQMAEDAAEQEVRSSALPTDQTEVTAKKKLTRKKAYIPGYASEEIPVGYEVWKHEDRRWPINFMVAWWKEGSSPMERGKYVTEIVNPPRYIELYPLLRRPLPKEYPTLAEAEAMVFKGPLGDIPPALHERPKKKRKDDAVESEGDE